MKRRFRIRWLLTAAVVVVLAAGLAWALMPAPVEVDVDRVTRGPLVVTVQEDGKARLRDRYIVSSPVAGQMFRVQLEPGDPVTAGETILTVVVPSPPELLNPRQLAAARARVEAAEAAVKRQDAVVQASQAAMEFAESELARLQRLAPSRAASRSELEAAELRYRTAVQDYRSATFAQEVARFELRQAEAQLLQVDPEANPSTPPEEGAIEIRAPVSGQVLRVMQESSAVVTAGTPILEIGDPRELELEIDVLSTDAVKMAPGMEVIVEHWGGPHPLHGHIRLVEDSAFTKISALGVEEQRVNVIVDLDDPFDQRDGLGDGYRVEARIVVWSSDDVVRVPVGALFRQEDDWAVFTIRDGRATLTPVRLGQRNELHAQVLEGLEVGQVVILYPTDRVREGTRVTARGS